MPVFFLYIRNITYYLMFVAIVGMLAPAGKYKKFVSLVMGFTLIGVMIAPLARFGRELPITNWFEGLGVYENADNVESSYIQWRNTYLRDAFEEQLHRQLVGLLEQNGFVVHSANFTYSDDFMRLTSMRLEVSGQEIEQRVPFIRIQPVRVAQQLETETCQTADTVKNLVSQFYNLPQEHIYVTVT